LRRNIAIAMGNSGVARWAPWLKRWAFAEAEANPCRETADLVAADPAQASVRDAARWALRRLAPVEKQGSAGS